MEVRETAEPDVDIAFFNELRSVFEKYPDAAQKYSISVRHNLKIDLDKQNGVSRTEGNRIVTEFRDVSDLKIAGSRHACCERYLVAGRWRCARWCLE